MARPLTNEEVLELVTKHAGDHDFARIAKSHEALRNQLERVDHLVGNALIALNAAKRPTTR